MKIAIFVIVSVVSLLLTGCSGGEIYVDKEGMATAVASGAAMPRNPPRITALDIAADSEKYLDQYVELHGTYMGNEVIYIPEFAPPPHADWFIAERKDGKEGVITIFDEYNELTVDNDFDGKIDALARYSQVTVWGWWRHSDMWYFEAVKLRIDKVYEPEE